ncbi:dihydroxy-acid dehydratase domain-containing protein, partial [Nostoc sp.]|uniref:dihydroxy-acid dehydratase domain-containing protein n=1 Tax=Nostoc sp. TaxID=1180 RepID=UPI002FF5FAC4
PARLLELNISESELARRRANWQPPAPRYTKGVLAKYTKLVSSSSLGAVTDLDLFNEETGGRRLLAKGNNS